MKQWTLEERYRVLKSPNEIKDLHTKISKSKYRQSYHIQPVTGLSSDPNGFVYHKGTWHLCYQWCPWGAVHGLKYWYHVSSKDLIFWKNEGIGLKPDCVYDNKGTHSGSAISINDELYFFYTGNHRNEKWIRTPYTCVAKVDDDGIPIKLSEPLFGPRADYSEHQRDPKVFYHKERKTYYIFIGAQTQDLRGCVLVYESKELLNGWHFAGELKVIGFENFGGMWECPCIQKINGKDILIFSPQYTKLPYRGENTNHNVYIIGKMDYDTLTFTPETDYQHLDYGFDFYAAQLASNVSDPDKAIIIAWIGLPDNHYPTAEEDWEGSMTLPRELRIKDNRLIQTPISGIESLRHQEIEPTGTLLNACEIQINVRNRKFDLNLFTDISGNGGFRFHYDETKQLCTIDRTGLKKRFNEEIGEILSMPLHSPLKHLQIFIDHCSIEIFANHGEATFTSHVYPMANEHHYTISENNALKIWSLNASIKDDFII
ncbi:MAG: sucrose-6-phosphate hydrolase [Lachnospiraceae bacterium]|nr:sucrose-6-phosphate hydrolase [Lachnospiraceae bacterium]